MQTSITVPISSQDQFSSFLMDHLKPITMRSHWDNELKINSYIKPLIQAITFITDLGEAEHTSDWDPSIRIQYWDQNDTLQSLETEPGYYIMQIQKENLILEDAENQAECHDQEDYYHTIKINTIHTIQLIRN